ncbi:MAG: hypothetical protein M3Y85_00810 [Bacteroidota bacterium]|nr:hypothetical protein [Bacteroidota bacterium]
MSINKSIRPNVFLFKNFTNEDHFTNSLGYILNLFPVELGARFLSRITDLTGLPVGHFGKFIKAEFSGHFLQNEDSTSKPDMIIHTSTTKIFFEVKLRAGLSKNQLERHFNDVDKDNAYLLLVSNIQTPISENVLMRKNYLKPQNQNHFIWSQFETVFNIISRKGGIKELLLNDFRQSLRSNGIKGRQIIGTEDNLYTNGSDAENLVLDKLKDMLTKIGFKAWRKKQEFTLRVNLEKAGKDPLLNPRIYPTGEWLNDACIKECMIVHCYSMNADADEILNKLDRLESIFENVKTYYNDVSSNHKYPDHYFYYIYIPLQFLKVENLDDLDWNYLEKIWRKIYELMKSAS